MKKYVLIIMLLSLAACTGAIPKAAFHPPQTAAEKQLDRILQVSNEDDEVLNVVLDVPWRDKKKEIKYKALFTGTLLQTLAEAEKKMVQANCNGTYIDGDICGFDFHPILCSQDPPEIYEYLTISSDEKQAFIRVKDPVWKELHTSYILVNVHGVWKMGGIDCGEGVSFNLGFFDR